MGKITKLECNRSKKDDFVSYKHIHASEKNGINKSDSVNTSNRKNLVYQKTLTISKQEFLIITKIHQSI